MDSQRLKELAADGLLMEIKKVCAEIASPEPFRTVPDLVVELYKLIKEYKSITEML